MTNFARRSLAFLILSVASCATLSNNPAFQAFGACTTQTLETAGTALLGQLQTIFSAGNYETSILPLIASTSWAEVQCGIDLLTAQLAAKKTVGAGTDAILTNLKAYRAAHPA
jgi:hypothetical protein